MSANALNRFFGRRRRRLATVAVMFCLATIVAVHHLPMDDTGMGDMAMHSASVVCLGVLPVLAVAIAAEPACRIPRLDLRALRVPVQRPLAPPAPRARSSPVTTVVLRL